jgi:hypothetical protein
LFLERQTQHGLELVNFSRVVCLPCREDTIRGYSDISILVIDEAARAPDDLYRAVRPMLAMWEEAARQSKEAAERFRTPVAHTTPAQFMLLGVCDDEKQQLALLERFQGEGLGGQGAVVVSGRPRSVEKEKPLTVWLLRVSDRRAKRPQREWRLCGKGRAGGDAPCK